MKLKIPVSKPRNPFVALARARKAGGHRDKHKFARARSLKSLADDGLREVDELRAQGLL